MNVKKTTVYVSNLFALSLFCHIFYDYSYIIPEGPFYIPDFYIMYNYVLYNLVLSQNFRFH